MSFRRVLTAVALVVIGVVFVGQVRRLLADPTIWPPDDFIEYWAAAKLTLDGGDPYDGDQLLPLQQSNGRDTDKAVMMWNPPWTLAVVLPLGLFPARAAQLLWLAVNFAAVCFCGDRLWRLSGGSAERRWVGWAVALAWLPTAFALQSGQIGPLLLLGAVLFLECERRGYPYLAGAATVLLAVKPHLAYLVWVAILLRATAPNGLKVIVGGAAAGIACSAFPMLFDPHVWRQYADAMGNRPPEEWVSPTIGTMLRLRFGAELFRLQFVPVLFGLAWFAWHRRKQNRAWNWAEQLPLLLLVSFVTAPYGAWPFDMVLLLPAAVRLVVKANLTPQPPSLAGKGEPEAPSPFGGGGWGRGHLILAGLVAVDLGCLVLNLLHRSSYEFRWVAPTVLALYIAGTWKGRVFSHSPSLPLSPSSPRVSA
jgi:hypothetical protein